MFGRSRNEDELSGIYKDIVLARAADPVLHEVGQDGGLVSAILLHCLDEGIIDAALVSYLEGDGTTWKAKPGVARTREDIIASAGSRYTYSSNTLAYDEAVESGAENIALVGMGCQSSIPGVMKARKAVLEDLRRRDLRGTLRGQVRPAQAGHAQDEHQGRLPDLDEERRLPRDPAQGVPRLDP